MNPWFEEYSEIICQNSYLWIHLWIHAIKFMIMQSYINLYYEFICESSAMKNIVKSWQDSFK